MLDQENTQIWNALSSFVQEICKDRDESHGYAHMEKVAKNSIDIVLHDYKDHRLFNSIMKDVIVVAWLHDVYDHKYDKDNILRQQTLDFLKSQSFVLFPSYIMNIIERISYSTEVKCIKENKITEWNDILGELGMIVRDIVSDADKIEALGKIGFDRCVLYAKEHYLKTTGEQIPDQLLKKRVLEHANEKLLRLKDEFIKTKRGKEIAEPLHNQLLELLKSL